MDCSLLVEFPYEFTDIINPVKILRNQTLNIPGKITPKCLEAYSVTFKWKFFKLNLNGSETEISINSNPSIDTLIFKIKEKSLFFGIYKFELEANLTVDTGYIKNIENVFSNSTKGYVQIIPAGMEIYVLENSLNYLKVGYNQSFKIEPTKFSFDYDQIAKFNELKFEFYCFVKNKIENFELLSLKNFTLSNSLFDYYQNLTSFSECFTDPSKKIFIFKSQIFKSIF